MTEPAAVYSVPSVPDAPVAPVAIAASGTRWNVCDVTLRCVTPAMRTKEAPPVINVHSELLDWMVVPNAPVPPIRSIWRIGFATGLEKVMVTMPVPPSVTARGWGMAVDTSYVLSHWNTVVRAAPFSAALLNDPGKLANVPFAKPLNPESPASLTKVTVVNTVAVVLVAVTAPEAVSVPVMTHAPVFCGPAKAALLTPSIETPASSNVLRRAGTIF